MTKEEEILLAAEEEFFNDGYDATTTAAIAKRAGVTHAMVNYYFKNKELLFRRVLDNNILNLINTLKGLMASDGSIKAVIHDTACTIFDLFENKRNLPFLLCDISRMHPEFLSPYKELLDTLFYDNMEVHHKHFERAVGSKALSVDFTFSDIFRTIITLAVTPFISLRFVNNVLGFTQERTENYLSNSRTEMLRILEERYSIEK